MDGRGQPFPSSMSSFLKEGFLERTSDPLLPILSGFDLVCHQPLSILPLGFLVPQPVSSALPCPPPHFTTAPVHSPNPWGLSSPFPPSPCSHSGCICRAQSVPGGPGGCWVGGLLGCPVEIPETALLLLPSTLPPLSPPLFLCLLHFLRCSEHPPPRHTI